MPVSRFGKRVDDPAETLRFFRFAGRLFMIVAPLVWLFFMALSFGLLGPVDIRPIQLGSQ